MLKGTVLHAGMLKTCLKGQAQFKMTVGLMALPVLLTSVKFVLAVTIKICGLAVMGVKLPLPEGQRLQDVPEAPSAPQICKPIPLAIITSSQLLVRSVDEDSSVALATGAVAVEGESFSQE